VNLWSCPIYYYVADSLLTKTKRGREGGRGEKGPDAIRRKEKKAYLTINSCIISVQQLVQTMTIIHEGKINGWEEGHGKKTSGEKNAPSKKKREENMT